MSILGRKVPGRLGSYPIYVLEVFMLRRIMLSMLFFVPLAQAEAEAPITQVTLYPGSATVERSAEIKAGTRLLEVGGLPANFDTKTLQIQADKGVRVGQIMIRDASGADGVHPREKALQKAVLELKDRIAALDIEVQSAGLVTGYLGRLDAGDKAAVDGRALRGIADGIEAAGKSALQRAQAAEISKRAIKEELDKAEFELAQLQSGARNFRSVSVQLAAEQTGRIRLVYQVNRAGWQPAYRAALDSGRSSIDLERLALVSQKTGEDWTGVKLRLSTGQPKAFREAVDPQTRRVVYHRPVPKEERSGRAYPAAAMAAPAPASALARKAELEVGGDYVAPVIETTGAFATEFDVPGTVTLAADGREIAVSLGKHNMTAAQHVQVTPAVQRIGVLVAEFERLPGVWLPGNIQLFRDGGYVGATRWNPAGAERFALSFGQDDLLRVSVDRKVLQDGTAGFTSQRLQRKVGDVYALTSLHRNAVDVVVLESSPVAQSEDVEIERVFQPQPSGDAWKNRPGVVYWNKTLEPEETWKIDIGYTITYPKEGSVSGLP